MGNTAVGIASAYGGKKDKEDLILGPNIQLC